MRTRFAPSPTGLLHLGHAYSALVANDMAREARGTFLLRIEDTDSARVQPEFEEAIYEDLRWLGLDWPAPVLRQSEHLDRYEAMLDRLIASELCYPCRCTRGDIRAALSAPQEGAPHLTPDGVRYPGTCRARNMAERGPGDAIRLDMARAIDRIGDVTRLRFEETGPEHRGTHRLSAEALLHEMGDIVLARRDIGAASYHLAVVVDDAYQGVTDVIRGTDLFEATFLHVLLQALLGLPTPTYHHHLLIRDEDGKRLAKRDDARAIRKFREEGAGPSDIRRMVGL